MPHVPDTIEELKKVLPEMKTKRITYVAEFLARRYGYKPSTMELYIHKKMFGTFLDVAEILDRMDENDAIIKERKKDSLHTNKHLNFLSKKSLQNLKNLSKNQVIQKKSSEN